MLKEISEKKYQKIMTTKNFSLAKDMFQKKIDEGEDILDLFKNNITLVNRDVFANRKNIYRALLKIYKEDNLISEREAASIEKLIELKEQNKIEEPELNLDKYFEDFSKVYQYKQITRENTMAFISLLLLYPSQLKRILHLTYKDVSLEKTSDILVVGFSDSKDEVKKIIITNKELADIYYDLFGKLSKEYGEDGKIFPESKQVTWTMTKTGSILFKELEEYIKNTEDDSRVKESNALTFIRREIVKKAKGYFTAI